MHINMTMEELTEQITGFLAVIGLPVSFEAIDDPTFLPGILIRNGGLVVDRSKLLYPGDMLHEAGHLAVMPPRIRQKMNGDLDFDPIHQGGELAAIAWSYAACVHLGIDSRIVFHEHGYKGGGGHLADNYEQGGDMGVPLLVWNEMTCSPRTGSEHAFPKMSNWLCTVDKYLQPQTT